MLTGPNAHTLNEKGAPRREGVSAQERRAGLDAVVDWLDAEAPGHLRYRPRDGLTFCNVYAHDFCHLAGCYLPRVWWTPAALVELAQGKEVMPLYGKTIEEMQANDLFRWLRDFGLSFGWRRAASLDELQLEADQGAVGVIVARRKEDGRSGHIVMVVPETGEWRARRDSGGRVIAALQSQAGATNFRRGTAKADWFKESQFAEFAFWLHA